jgi:Zn-dependent protease
MSNWWVLDFINEGKYVELLSWIFWVLFSITMHELAHGWAALWQGDQTPRQLHRMTANPIVHMGPMSLLMFAIIGVAWGVMPVDPSRFRWRRRGRIVVSGAGPAMNLLLALVALTAFALWLRYGTNQEPLARNVSIFLSTGGMLNIVLALLNLLPVPPLDGSSILMGLSLRSYQLFQHPNAQMIGMFVVLAIFISGASVVIFHAADAVSAAYVKALTSALP